MPTLHQFVPTLDGGAIGAHIIEIQRTMREAGWDSEVFSEHTKPPYDGQAHLFTDYGDGVPAHPEDVVVYHAAIGSSVADWLLSRRPPRLLVDYHNITPPSWFQPWEPALAYGLGWGRAQLHRLGRRVRVGLADSAFNAAELDAVGVRRTIVLPILVPPESIGGAPDQALLSRLRATPGARWVFVGRLAPNKRQHLIIASLAAFRRVYDPHATLALVGAASSPAYEDALRRYAADLGLADAVTFTGEISNAERNAYYAASHVFVCLSGHEGFLVPLLEAWQHRVPIVAFRAAAVPETLGPAGILLSTTSPVTVAATVARVCGDGALARGLVESGLRRLDRFSIERVRAELRDVATSLVAAR
jgi:glycosyltransferase involved in cell wall biosynthesis